MTAGAPATSTPSTATAFRYEAQFDDGQRMSGTLDAPNVDQAVARLHAMRLRVIDIAPMTPAAITEVPGAGKAVSGDDFLAFNEQLAHLAASGIPLEAGLRMIAKDIRRGRLSETVRQVAEALDRGTPISQAFDSHAGRLPSLYGRLLEAGVKTGDLAGVLLNFGRHLQLTRKLRLAMRRTFTYPLVVLVCLSILMMFFGLYILPRFQEMYEAFGLRMPWPTQALFDSAFVIPWVAGAVLVSLAAMPFVWAAFRARNAEWKLIDAIVLRTPLIGRAVKLSLIARWCDALRIGVAAGLPLPQAVALAGDAVPSPRLRRDGESLSRAIESGAPLTQAEQKLDVLPATVPTTIELASGRRDLPSTLQSLADLYERQAEMRVNALPAVLSPIMVIIAASMIGFVIFALLLGMIQLIEGMLRPF